MSVCVVGGSGFIGTRLVRRLCAGHGSQVLVFDKVRSNSFPELTALGDVRSVEDLRNTIPHGAILVNLAAER